MASGPRWRAGGRSRRSAWPVSAYRGGDEPLARLTPMIVPRRYRVAPIKRRLTRAQHEAVAVAALRGWAIPASTQMSRDVAAICACVAGR